MANSAEKQFEERNQIRESDRSGLRLRDAAGVPAAGVDDDGDEVTGSYRFNTRGDLEGWAPRISSVPPPVPHPRGMPTSATLAVNVIGAILLSAGFFGMRWLLGF
ncbi:MAG: hypothetical protein KC416_00650 [Myxococcales bacterium]|nr:hypothetical protein [Myxococcales bacterium]